MSELDRIARLVVLERNFFVDWFKKHGRNFPWRKKGTSPYGFLITEMLVRQTRAPEVSKVWVKFIEKFPDARTLACAQRDELYEMLKFLGFGAQKADALLSAASYLVKHHDGEVPESLEQLLAVPHLGQYSARAILCFGFGDKIEIVDTNILRFFSRYYGLVVKPDIRRNPDVWEIARKMLPHERKKAIKHNYGMLDFTATICKPGRPRCEICPLNTSCAWGRKQVQGSLA